MARPNKRKQHIRKLAKEKKRKCDLKDSSRKIKQEPGEHGEPSEVAEDVTAIGLLQRSAGSVSAGDEFDNSESKGDELPVSEEEELEEVDESTIEKSIKR